MRNIVPNNERFWSFVSTSDDCWICIGPRNKKGYGKFEVRLADGTYTEVPAHRFAYELLIGPIPSGMVLDHIECDNPPCVNPGHTIPSSHRDNILRGRCNAAMNYRKTHCIYGHEFTKDNTYTPASGGRHCKECQHIRNLRRINGIRSASIN